MDKLIEDVVQDCKSVTHSCLLTLGLASHSLPRPCLTSLAPLSNRLRQANKAEAAMVYMAVESFPLILYSMSAINFLMISINKFLGKNSFGPSEALNANTTVNFSKEC